MMVLEEEVTVMVTEDDCHHGTTIDGQLVCLCVDKTFVQYIRNSLNKELY